LGVKTRNKDYLQTEEEALNNMLEVLSGKLELVREATKEAFESVDELEKAANMGNGWTKAQVDLLRTHRDHLERLVSEVQFFRSQNEDQITSRVKQDA
jgi:phage-related tail protein